MSDQKICPTCGTEYPLSERFCPRDGTALRSANVQADLLGSVIADRYHILKKLGEGGMGTVYLAEHVKMGRKSALKVMNPGMNTDPDAIARFNREASNASRLSHPNICGIYDFGETPDGMIYLAMEFIEGSSLTSLIEKAGQLAPPRAASIVHQTADALQVAHDAGIVHRDLKPDNIMVARNRDGTDLVKVVDFGIAKASSSDAQKVTKTGMVVGTPEYMSPEQLAGDKLDGRSDLYSLGLVAFNCLTGMLPFAAETAQEAMIMRLTDRPRSLADVRPDVSWPAALQATLDKALARDVEERYKSAAQFGREFAAAIADMPMTQAVEAGTMVMNAAAAGKETVPPTRMNPARQSEKTTPMQVPVAPKRPTAGAAPVKAGSKVPMIAGAGGGLALLVGVGLYLTGVIGPAAKPESPTGSAQLGTSIQPPSGPVTGDTSAQRVGANPGASGTVPLSAPGASIPNTTPGTKKPTDPPGTTKSPPATVVDPSPTAATMLKAWIRELDTGNPDEAEGKRVLAEVNQVFGRLTGEELADGWFVRMQAYASMGDERTCDAAREVKARSGDATKRLKADEFLRASCP
ncbi:MAG: protein kinase [Gemmatimonadetes bacterium]|nr:protein kinase [Gemmatimonadota bacterium]